MKLLAGLLLIVAGCLLGCQQSAARWKVTNATMNSQFEVTWGTTLKIGFPGTFTGTAEGEGEQKKQALPAAPAQPTP